MMKMQITPVCLNQENLMKNHLCTLATTALVAGTIFSFVNAAAAGPFINTAAIKNAAPPIVVTARWGGWGWGFGGGLLAGAIIGGALAAPYYGYPSYSYGYGYPYYGYGYGYPYYYGYGYPRYHARYYRPWGWRRG